MSSPITVQINSLHSLIYTVLVPHGSQHLTSSLPPNQDPPPQHIMATNNSTAPTPEQFQASFPNPAIPQIEGKPKYESLDALRSLLVKNAASVSTTLDGGLFGHSGCRKACLDIGLFVLGLGNMRAICHDICLCRDIDSLAPVETHNNCLPI